MIYNKLINIAIKEVIHRNISLNIVIKMKDIVMVMVIIKIMINNQINMMKRNLSKIIIKKLDPNMNNFIKKIDITDLILIKIKILI